MKAKARLEVIMPPGEAFISTIYSKRTNIDRMGLNRLNEDTRLVCINGSPFAWAIETILDMAPNLKTIQVIPSHRDYISKRSIRLLKKRGISIVTGRVFPRRTWRKRENRNPEYVRYQKMLRSLDHEARRMFDELCSLGIREALVTRRYFCLDGDQFMSQSQLAKKFGLSDKKNNAIAVSVCIHGTMRYLGKRTSASVAVARRAEWIRRRVALIRRNEAKNALKLIKTSERDRFVRFFGLPKIPANLPCGKMETLGRVLTCFSDGKIDELARLNSRLHMILLYRFGLEQWKSGRIIGGCRTHKDIALMIGVSRERVRQLEEKALEFLGVEG